ncbi:hypothetical protein ABPG75_008118 [Micractinium tetrahymenae]
MSWRPPGGLLAWALCGLLLLVALTSGGARVAAKASSRETAAAQGSSATALSASFRRLAGRADEEPQEGRRGAAANITATYKGEWSKRIWRKQLASSGPLQQRSGVAVLKLRSAGLAEGGVVNVEGEMVLRDGQYVSSGDVVLNVQGVHVPAAGKLMAVVEPVVPIRLPARRTLQQRQQELAGEHRSSSSSSSSEGEGQGRGGSAAGGERGMLPHGALGLSGRADAAAEAAMAAVDAEAELEAELEAEQQEEVLRAAAHQVALLAAKMREEGVEVRRMPDPSGRFEEARRWQRCEFRLELAVTPAAGAAASAGGAEPPAGAAASALGRRMAPGGRWPALGSGPSPGDVVLNGTLTSRNCGTRLTLSLATAHVEEYYSKAANYTLMITVLGLLQVLLLVRQMEACATPALASRVSLLTLAHQAVLDAYLCLVHLTLGIMVESLFHSFGAVAFMQFVVFAIFEMRFLLSVWRARRGGVDAWTAQREVSVLYARFYATLLGGILLTYQLQRHMPLLMFAFFSFWWPQIVLCARSDSRQPLKPEFVLGTSAARLALPLYVYACPSNLLRVAPNPPLCAALVAWVALQAGLLLAQHWLGPRCFIPRALLPRRYDYSRPVPPACGGGGDIETGDGGGRECVICMQLVDVSSKAQRAVTPCNHVFHKACLERWLSYKHDCPTCRRLLPPL